jgi:hypothetical protein
MVPERKFTGIMSAVLMLSLVLVLGCGQKSAQEKLSEQALEKATGKDVDVKRDGGNIQITDGQSNTEIATTTVWPPSLTGEVPKFTAGKIQRVVTSREQGEAWSFNIYLVDFGNDDMNTYEKALKGKGWTTENIQMGGKGGMLNAQKGTMGINFMFNAEKKDGMLAVYNRP